MDEVKIYIADDHAIVVEGLIEILKSKPHLKIIGTATNGKEITVLMNSRRADVVIMDINMPVMNGLQCTKWIKEKFPKTKVIVLTMYPEKSYIAELLNVGADGCLLKSNGSIELLNAIERVSQDKAYFDLLSDFKEQDNHPVFNLSEREIQIIRLIVNGLTSMEIADKIFISEHTVKTHRKNIFRKTGINSISQLTRFAINNQIL